MRKRRTDSFHFSLETGNRREQYEELLVKRDQLLDLKKAEEYYKGLLNDEVFKDTDSMFFPLAKKRLLEMEE